MDFASGESADKLWKIVQAVLNANASVVMLVMLGVAATFKGVFDQKGISDLGKLVYHISLPSLLLVNIMREVTVEHLYKLWILPVFCTFHVVLAYYLGTFISCCCRLSEVEHRPVVATIMFGNVGALTIAIVEALCLDEPMKSSLGGSASCSQKSVSYIAFYLITQNIWMFTWGEHILFAKKQETAKKLEGKESTSVAPLLATIPEKGGMNRMKAIPSLTNMALNHDESLDLSRLDEDLIIDDSGEARKEVHVLTSEAIAEAGSRLPLEVKAWSAYNHGGMPVTDDDLDCLQPIRMLSRHMSGTLPSDPEQKGMISRGQQYLKAAPRRTYRGVRRRLINGYRSVCAMTRNPPLQAAFVALVLGLWPPLKAMFVGEGAPLRCVLRAVGTLGSSQVPVSMLMLSGSGTLRYLQKQSERLAEERPKDQRSGKPETFSFSRKAVWSMILGRILGVPLIGYLVWRGFCWLQWFPDDPLLGFIVLIEAAVPSAQNVVMLLLVHGELEQGAAMAEVVLWQYAVAVPIFTILATLFLFTSFA